jgi:PAS domain S-box-containing protein
MGISRDITERKRADQALRESEARFRELFENANDIVYTHDLAGNFTSINRATEQVTGYARDEALTMNIAQVIAPEYLEPIRQWLDPKGIGQGPLTHELEIITKDGRRVLLELGTRLIFREGKPVGVQGIARDITERKRAEAALAQERNLLHTLFDHLPDSVWIKDTESRFVMGNLGVTRHVGAATPEEIIGKSDFDFFPKDLAEQYYADEQQVVRSGQPLLNKEEIVEDQTTGKRLWNLVTKVPLRNAAGNIVGLVGIGRDITARKRAEEKLRESEARLRLALQSAPVTMFRQDRELKYTWIHNVQVAMQPEEIVGKSDSDFVPPDQAARLTELKGRALTSGNKVRDEVNVVVQGALYSYEMIVEPERDAAGQIVGITGVTWDITERKRAEQKLQESETKFRAVFETSVDAIGVSKKGAHVFVNPAYCTLFGYGSAGELVGTSILNLIAPEQREKIAQNVRRRARNEAIPSFYETRGLRKDGSEFEMDVHISTYELQGETFSLVILRDITEQKQAKAVQQRSHEELEQRVQARTAELQQFVDLMVGREIRMAELKSVVRQLRAQLQSAGMTPVADDPLAAGME